MYYCPRDEYYLKKHPNATLEELIRYRNIIDFDRINIDNMRGKYYIFSSDTCPKLQNCDYLLVNGDNIIQYFDIKESRKKLILKDTFNVSTLDQFNYNRGLFPDKISNEQYFDAHFAEINELEYNTIIKDLKEIKDKYRKLIDKKIMPLKKIAKKVNS